MIKYRLFTRCEFVNRTTNISDIPVKISRYEMLSTFFSSRYIRWNGNFGVEHCLRAHLLFHVHRDFLSPNEIFSLWRNKIRDLLSTTELYFESNGNAPFQFINSSNNAMQQLSILWGRQSLLKFFYQWIHRGNREFVSLPNYYLYEVEK